MLTERENEPLRIGAVAYDPKVVAIWEGFQEYFAQEGIAIDYVLYSNYESQVDANLKGEIDVAWNSPLAWVKSQILSAGNCRAIAMRDSDRDLTTKVLVPAHSKLNSVSDLRGARVAVGASDSPQATLIPLGMIANAGIDIKRDIEVLYHNVMVGKHGDHVGGERDAAKALAAGLADAACVLDANYAMFINEGTLDPGTTRVLASTAPFDHCNFTVREDSAQEKVNSFLNALLAMSFQDSRVRVLMELEGLKRWLPARTTGYAQLERAVQIFQLYDAPASAGQR